MFLIILPLHLIIVYSCYKAMDRNPHFENKRSYWRTLIFLLPLIGGALFVMADWKSRKEKFRKPQNLSDNKILDSNI